MLFKFLFLCMFHTAHNLLVGKTSKYFIHKNHEYILKAFNHKGPLLKNLDATALMIKNCMFGAKFSCRPTLTHGLFLYSPPI